MNRPTSWEVKETFEREERDADAIQWFGQSLVDKKMSILEAEAVYEEPCEVSPNTGEDDEDIYSIEEEQELYTYEKPKNFFEEELYEDLVPREVLSPPGPTSDEKPKSFFTNTKVRVLFIEYGSTSCYVDVR